MRTKLLRSISLCMTIVSLIGVLISYSGMFSINEYGLVLILSILLLIMGIFGFVLSYMSTKSNGLQKEWKAMTVLFPRVGVLHNQHYVERLREEEDQRYQDRLRQDELAKDKKD